MRQIANNDWDSSDSFGTINFSNHEVLCLWSYVFSNKKVLPIHYIRVIKKEFTCAGDESGLFSNLLQNQRKTSVTILVLFFYRLSGAVNQF